MPSSTASRTVCVRVELRLLRQEADAHVRASAPLRLRYSLSSPAMMRSRLDLPEPFRPSTPILAPGKNDSEMSLRIDALGRDDLAHAVHRVNVLSHGSCCGLRRFETAIIAGGATGRGERDIPART